MNRRAILRSGAAILLAPIIQAGRWCRIICDDKPGDAPRRIGEDALETLRRDGQIASYQLTKHTDIVSGEVFVLATAWPPRGKSWRRRRGLGHALGLVCRNSCLAIDDVDTVIDQCAGDLAWVVRQCHLY